MLYAEIKPRYSNLLQNSHTVKKVWSYAKWPALKKLLNTGGSKEMAVMAKIQ